MNSLYLQLVGVAALWGGTFIAGRIAAPELPHFTVAGLRFWVAFAILAPLLIAVEGQLPRFRPRDLGYTALLALFGLVLYNLLFLGALELIPAGRTALVVALNPTLTALAMALVFGERLRGHRWLGILLALTGVWIVLSKGDPSLLLQRAGRGEWLMLGGACCWAIYTVVGRHTLGGEPAFSPLALTTVAILWGALMLTAGIPFEWDAWRANEVSAMARASIVYLGAGGTALAFVWYAEGLKRLGAACIAVFNNLVPVFGVMFGTLMIGGLVAIAGVNSRTGVDGGKSVSCERSRRNGFINAP